MDRRFLVKAAGMAAVLGTGVAPAVHAQAAVRWRLASSFPRSLDTIYGAAEVFAHKVRQLSGGRFEVSVHAAGERMPAFSVVDGVQKGTVEAAHTAPYYFFEMDETFAIGGAIPFGLNSRQMSAWTYEGNGLKLMREFYAHYGIVSFPCGNTGAQMGGWMRKEIRSVQDLQGLKFRIGGFAGKVLERLGGLPQNIPGGDIYQALEKGSIDAAEWIGPYDDQKLGFNKVAPYYLETASTFAHVVTQAKYDVKNPGALKQLVGAGAKLRPFPADVMSGAFKQSMALYDELSRRNPRWNRVYADYQKFRSDQNLWFRFTEATFDRFMQSQKL